MFYLTRKEGPNLQFVAVLPELAGLDKSSQPPRGHLKVASLKGAQNMHSCGSLCLWDEQNGQQ